MNEMPPGKPAFLSRETAEAAAYSGEPDAVPTFDTELEAAAEDSAPSRGIINRYREVARLHACGRTNNEIAAILGYTASRLSLILANDFVQAEIARYRERLFDEDLVEQMKDVARDGLRHIHGSILDPKEKAELRSTNARWAVEHVKGKANQSISVESGTLNSFIEIARDMLARGESIDATAHPMRDVEALGPGASVASDAAAPADPIGAWLDTNFKP